MNPNHVLGISFISALVIAIFGAWFLMRAVKTRSSQILFWLLVGLLFWLPLSQTLLLSVLSYQTSWESSWAGFSPLLAVTELIVPALLVVGAAISFLFVAHAVLRSNNSFKPTPRRGAA